MLKLRSPNNTQLANSRLADFMRRMRETLRENRGANMTDLSKVIAKGFSRFFIFSGKPQIDLDEVQLHKFQLPSVRRWNELMEAIDGDIQTAYDELESLGQLSIAVHNYGQVLMAQLRDKAAEAASKIIDVRFQASQLDSQLIVAGDDFSDLSKVDQTFPLQNPRAEVLTEQGVVTLTRAEAVNVFAQAGVEIDVKPLNPGVTTDPTPDNTARFYEGNFYDFLGQSRPEGGKFHLEEKVRPGVVRSGAGGVKVINLESSSFFNEVGDLRRGADGLGENNPINPEDIVIVDRGASPAEKNEVRRRMLDGNPDTFWECEVVFTNKSLEFLAKGIHQNIEDVAGTEFVPPAAGGTIQPTISAERRTGTTSDGKNSSYYTVYVEPFPNYDPATPERLRAAAAASEVDQFDLELELAFRLPRPTFLNFLTLNPYNFDEAAWLEIFEVSTSPDESSAFELIEGFENNQFENTLTGEANEELSPEEAKQVLSPDRYAYRGQGVWSFPVRTVSRIKFKIRQKTPVPNPYQTLVVQLRRQLIRTIAR